MNRIRKTVKALFTAVVLMISVNVSGTLAQTMLEFETGIVIPGYNDVAVPGDSGTRFSLTEDLDADNSVACRIRLSRTFSEKHCVGVMAALLTMKSNGLVDADTHFNGTVFPQDSAIDAKFRFDSYRLIYRYHLYRSDTFQCSLGGALKIRDAAIELDSKGLRSVKKNTGFVPLASFNLTWEAFDQVRFILDGEALAAPQGRAEDVVLATQYDVTDSFKLSLGYRILEGGADNDEVYTFSLFHYFVLGASWSF